MNNDENKELTLEQMVIKTREVFSSQIVYELEQNPSLNQQEIQKLLYDALNSRLDIFKESNPASVSFNADDFMPVIHKCVHDFFQAKKYKM